MLSCLVPDGDVSYKKMNEIAGVDHKKHFVGNKQDGSQKGLTPDELQLICDKTVGRTKKLVHEPKKLEGVPQTLMKNDYGRELYAMIESKGPALLAFQSPGSGGRHVIPVIGHTFNEDTWTADADRHYFGNDLAYYQSEQWLSSYVVHDDNFGPLLCLPRHYVQQDNVRMLIGLAEPENTMDALDAEGNALDLLRRIVKSLSTPPSGWIARFCAFSHANLLVLRTIHVAKKDYIEHLNALQDWEGHALDSMTLEMFDALPDQFYMIEVSAPELFSASRRKFGEILLAYGKPFDPEDIWKHFLTARLPGLLFNRQSDTVCSLSLNLTGHSPIFSRSK
jgi:hypothetical protein